MHLDLIIRDGQKKIAHVEVQTFEGDLFCAQLAFNKGEQTRIAVPLDASEYRENQSPQMISQMQ